MCKIFSMYADIPNMHQNGLIFLRFIFEYAMYILLLSAHLRVNVIPFKFTIYALARMGPQNQNNMCFYFKCIRLL